MDYDKQGQDDDSKATPDQPEQRLTEDFYPPQVVASMVTALFLGAREDGTPYGSFREQLAETQAKARTGSAPQKDLANFLTAVINFHDAGNQDLFLNAHLGIKILLKKLAADGQWSPCLTVSRTTVLQMAGLPKP